MSVDSINKNQSTEASSWWGEYIFEIDTPRTWQFGSLILRITRHAQEWRMEYHRPVLQHDDEMGWHEILDTEFMLPEPVHIERYMFRKTQPQLQLMPKLADHSVVIHPVEPIYVPAGQKGLLYVTTPLWLVGFAEGQEEPLFDMPIIQPKETWFGPDTRKGELCYATEVNGRTDLDKLRHNLFRAVTPVIFQNTSHEQLRFDRMNVPIVALPLFYSESTNRLWTSHIKVMHDSSDRLPRIKIENRTPPRAGEVMYMHAPRSPGGVLFNMFDSFF
ncbi:hypothetical protein [Acinetobacter boissieri]|uniref:DUF432 domain-containing protein n=1 Tax=Acinetobacter boissieri TaxID=1219383 RepID=A0A1G6KAI7_9GAMM|nr:hypothetical protein [Acinetobacter boissieri]SDC27878.1 hypothetical protein SAMN05421733_11543 [Acinetobacter boissieri]